MTKLLWPTVIGAVISTISLVGFMQLAATGTPELKHLAKVFYLAATGALFLHVGWSGGLALQVAFGVVMTVVAVVVLQVVQLFQSGGVSLGNGPEPWTAEHLSQTVFSLAVAGVWYGLVVGAAYAATRVARAVRARRA